MIYGIGVDIAAISRFQFFMEQKNPILERLFCKNELEVCTTRKDGASSLAARFAAKEAFLKALGTGLRNGISWHDMEVVNTSLGKPEFNIYGKAFELCRNAGIQNILLSLSHDGGNAVAMVVLESL